MELYSPAAVVFCMKDVEPDSNETVCTTPLLDYEGY